MAYSQISTNANYMNAAAMTKKKKNLKKGSWDQREEKDLAYKAGFLP